MASLMRRTLVRTRAPIFSSLRRIVPQAARGELGVRQADAAQGADHDMAIAANHSRNWLARMVLAEVRSA
jgi:hypothetical protein